MGNLMLHHNRSSQKHINQFTKFIKNTIAKHELKRRPMNLLPRHIIRKRHDLKKKKKRKYYEHTLISGQQKNL